MAGVGIGMVMVVIRLGCDWVHKCGKWVGRGTEYCQSLL